MGNSCKIVCNYHKERRPYTANDAGRVICYAREGGATWEAIKDAANQRCGPLPEGESDCEDERRALEVALAVLALAGVALVAVATRGKALGAIIKAGDKAAKHKTEFERLLDKAWKPVENELDRLPAVQQSITEAEALFKDLLARGPGVVIRP